MQDRFADNLSWPYHSIPFLTGVIGLLIGSYLVEPYGPLAKTIFPPACLIVGGFGGLVILGTSLIRSQTSEFRMVASEDFRLQVQLNYGVAMNSSARQPDEIEHRKSRIIIVR